MHGTFAPPPKPSNTPSKGMGKLKAPKDKPSSGGRPQHPKSSSRRGK